MRQEGFCDQQHALLPLVTHRVGAQIDDDASGDLQHRALEVIGLPQELLVVLQAVHLDGHEVGGEVVVQVPGAVRVLQLSLSGRLRKASSTQAAQEFELGQRVRAPSGVVDGLQDESSTGQRLPRPREGLEVLRSYEPLLYGRGDQSASPARSFDGDLAGTSTTARGSRSRPGRSVGCTSDLSR
jgi:hypothetical protein